MIKQRGAFTLAETLVAISIVVLLAAILFPVVVNAKRKAGEVRSISNMKQIYYALAMYISEHDGDGIYGKYDSMGLPPGLKPLADQYKIPQEVFMSGGVSTLNFSMPPLFYTMWPNAGDSDEYGKPWLNHVTKHEQNAVLLVDPWHNYGYATTKSDFVTRKGIALRLEGSVKVRVRRGDPLDFSFWE